ncbi:MAG: retropepsin-like domain-containing protein [Gemmataceae bacterium]|nr:retropepsin-like domain-containing protein [Gemmataceae bacterium]
MQFPYTEVRPGSFRPKIPVLVRGVGSLHVIDGLLDTGADRTMVPLQVALNLGIDVATLGPEVRLQSGTGQILSCRIAHLILELRRLTEQITWLAEVVVPTQHLPHAYWGFKGFLEFFRAEFDGPNHLITLTAGDNLPATVAPP